jgi:DNA-3-methyladenine glycosylase II
VRSIESLADIRSGVRALSRACPIMREVHRIAGEPPLRRLQPGFEGLARIVVSQQLSTASAAAIWGRLVQAIDPISAHGVLASGDDRLRAAGLSGPKIRTMRALANAVADGGLDLDVVQHASEEAIHEALTTVSGIGPWTADIYIMFCLGRADAFAHGDLALQIAAQHAAGLEQRPQPAELLQLAERWRPWRGVAARLLWAYYPHMKKAIRNRDEPTGPAAPI